MWHNTLSIDLQQTPLFTMHLQNMATTQRILGAPRKEDARTTQAIQSGLTDGQNGAGGFANPGDHGLGGGYTGSIKDITGGKTGGFKDITGQRDAPHLLDCLGTMS